MTSNCDNKESPDFSQLLPSEPLSPAELGQVERITSLEDDLMFTLSENLDDLDDIDLPRLEEEQIICDVPLTFRREKLFISLVNIVVEQNIFIKYLLDTISAAIIISI